MGKTLANGGSKAGEDAISRALDYLKRTQNADGSWGTSEKAGRTGLALLAYLGRCETVEVINVWRHGLEGSSLPHRSQSKEQRGNHLRRTGQSTRC